MLAGFLGYHIITRVPPLLHTPLMSATNAIAAISLVGSLVVAGSDYSGVPHGWVCTLLGLAAVTCSSTNAVGGFLITDRMLGMSLAAFGMFVAVVGTLFHPHIVTYRWIGLGFALGAVVGGTMGLRIPMTAVPQRTAMSHSLGALAACLVGVSEYFRYQGALSRVTLTALDFEVVVGGLTFTGSLIAAAKLQELLRGRPITYRGQNIMSLSLLSIIVGSGIYLVVTQAATAF